MGSEYTLLGSLSSKISSMAKIGTYRKQSPSFGAWLASQIKLRGMNQREFAERMGVSQSTVSRWIKGRVPDGSFIDLIADVLVLDYDLVSMQAGYRPRLSMDQINQFRAIAEPYAKRIDWTVGRNIRDLVRLLDQIISEQEISEGKRSVDQFFDSVEVKNDTR